MLLTLTTNHFPATDLGYLLHKRPDRFQTFKSSFGAVHVYYEVANEEICTACLLLDVDPIGLIRKSNPNQPAAFALENYVNDRPYACSSFMSVAISEVFSSALNGACNKRPELVDIAMRFAAKLDVLVCSGGERFIRQIFEPLGYEVQVEQHAIDSHFPEWGEGNVYSVQIQAVKVLSELLSQLYVLIPVLDNDKHYYVSEQEIEKLLVRGKGWLASHPLKDVIVRRYLKHQIGLQKEAHRKLADKTLGASTAFDGESLPALRPVEPLEEPLQLNELRYESVLKALEKSNATHVLDLGCGEGKLLKRLVERRRFQRATGVDFSLRALEIATRRLRVEQMNERQRERVQLLQGSALYRDSRFRGYDAILAVEVIEHIELNQLPMFEHVVFGDALPEFVIITTPNQEFNQVWPTLPAGSMRHSGHKFEWTRNDFQCWAKEVAHKYQYTVDFEGIGESHPEFGTPTQMAVFTRNWN